MELRFKINQRKNLKVNLILNMEAEIQAEGKDQTEINYVWLNYISF